MQITSLKSAVLQEGSEFMKPPQKQVTKTHRDVDLKNRQKIRLSFFMNKLS